MTARSLVVSWLIATPALASSALQMDVPALTHAATDIIRGRVTSSHSAWTDDHRRVVTLVELQVLDSWKGQTVEKLTVAQPGGERDGFGQSVAGVATLETGQELVLFLERQGSLFRVVGLSQGVYRVERPTGEGVARAVPVVVEGLRLVAPAGRTPGARTPLPLEELRGLVRREAR